jgi:predicted RNA-binding Zn-ribbon protein involved in translation (DUF1610 family)
MTSPSELVSIECPECGHRYETWHRASINLCLDPGMDEDYIREASTGTCPECGFVAELGVLVVEPDGVWRLA